MPGLNEFQDADVARLYADGEAATSLASRFGVSLMTVYKSLRRSGTPLRAATGTVSRQEKAKHLAHPTMSEAQQAEASVLYLKGHTFAQIATGFAASSATVRRSIIRSGVPMRVKHRSRRYAIDHAFFDRIDTEGKAYMLGFHAADGHCGVDGMSFEIHERDESILIDFSRLIGSDAPIKRFVRTGSDPRHNSTPSVRVRFNSRMIVKALDSLGMSGAKTFRVRPPDMPPALLRHFWRGVFDGDGWIGLTRTGPHMTLAGNRQMTEGFRDFVLLHTPTPARQKNCYKRDSIWAVQYKGTLIVPHVARLLYDGCNIALPRKLTIAREMLAG